MPPRLYGGSLSLAGGRSLGLGRSLLVLVVVQHIELEVQTRHQSDLLSEIGVRALLLESLPLVQRRVPCRGRLELRDGLCGS